MAERSYPRDWISLLPTEADRWVQVGLITAEQRAAIVRLYPEEEAAGRDRTIVIFSILGSLLVGLGIILFFAANWPKLAASVKVAAIMVAIVVTYASGYYMQMRTDYPRIGQSLILLGGIMYGAGVWLIAQIFHLQSHYPTGFLIWAVGLLPMAWAMRSLPLLYLTTTLLTVWTVMEQGSFEQFNYLYPVLLMGTVFPLTRRLNSALNEATVIGGLLVWYGINVVRMDIGQSMGHEMALIARIVLLYGGAVMAAGLARLGDQRVYLGLGSLLTLLGTYLLTFSFPVWMDGNRTDLPLSPIWSGPTYLLVGVGVILAVIGYSAWQYWNHAERGRIALLTVVLVPVVAAFGVHLLLEVPRMVTFNLLLFVETVGLILLSVQRRSQLLLNLGLLAFVVHILTRYFDLFFSAMDRSLFFVLGGLLLLGGGWLLERNRRRWMQEWGGEDHDR